MLSARLGSTNCFKLSGLGYLYHTTQDVLLINAHPPKPHKKEEQTRVSTKKELLIGYKQGSQLPWEEVSSTDAHLAASSYLIALLN